MKTIEEVLSESEIEPEKLAKSLSEKLPEIANDISENIYKNIKTTSSSLLKANRKDIELFKKKKNKYWGKALDELEIMISISLEVGDRFNRLYRSKTSNKKLFEALTKLHARGCQVGFEILTLLQSGFADGAHARWRSLHEIAVIALFVEKQGNDTAEKFLLHEGVEKYRALLQYQKYCKVLGQEPFTVEEVASFKQINDKLCKKYGQSFKKDYGWASSVLNIDSPTLLNLEENVGLDYLRPYFKWASDNVHATSRGTSFRLGLIDHQSEILLGGPSDAGLADPGHCTAISILQLTSALLKINPDFDSLVVNNVLQIFCDKVEELFLEGHNRLDKFITKNK